MVAVDLGALGGIGGASIDEPRARIYFLAGASGAEEEWVSLFVLNDSVDAGTTRIRWWGIGQVGDNNLGASRPDLRNKTKGWARGVEHSAIIENRRPEVDNGDRTSRKVRSPSELSEESIPEQFGSRACRFGGVAEGTVYRAILLDLWGRGLE